MRRHSIAVVPPNLVDSALLDRRANIVQQVVRQQRNKNMRLTLPSFLIKTGRIHLGCLKKMAGFWKTVAVDGRAVRQQAAVGTLFFRTPNLGFWIGRSLIFKIDIGQIIHNDRLFQGE